MRCIICSKGSRRESVLDESFDLCKLHSAMIESDLEQLIEQCQTKWNDLFGDKYIARRNALYSLIRTCNKVKSDG